MAKRNNTINPVQKYNKKKQKREIEKVYIYKKFKNNKKVSNLQNNSSLDSKIELLAQKELKGKITRSEQEQLKLLQKQKTKLLEQSLTNAEKSVNKDFLVEAENAQGILPKDPLRSVFYDPVYNPFGAPPPGETYKEVDELEYEKRLQSINYDIDKDKKYAEPNSDVVLENLKTINEKEIFEGLDPDNLPSLPKEPDYIAHNINEKPKKPNYPPPKYILDMYKAKKIEINKENKARELSLNLNKKEKQINPTKNRKNNSALLFDDVENSIYAEPVLKDFKKESTKLMPSVILKKKEPHNMKKKDLEDQEKLEDTIKEDTLEVEEKQESPPTLNLNTAPNVLLLEEYSSE